MKKRVYKGHHGWTAETAIDMPDNRVLTILTMKRSGGQLETTASVGTKDNGFVSHRVHQDYHKRLIVDSPKRVTEKVVQQQHDSVDITALTEQVLKFYGEVCYE
jgi:hypothetical protein